MGRQEKGRGQDLAQVVFLLSELFHEVEVLVHKTPSQIKSTVKSIYRVSFPKELFADIVTI